MNGRPSSSMPSSEMTTVEPAKSTARPAVASEVMTASRGLAPRCSASRWRVTMKSA